MIVWMEALMMIMMIIMEALLDDDDDDGGLAYLHLHSIGGKQSEKRKFKVIVKIGSFCHFIS